MIVGILVFALAAFAADKSASAVASADKPADRMIPGKGMTVRVADPSKPGQPEPGYSDGRVVLVDIKTDEGKAKPIVAKTVRRAPTPVVAPLPVTPTVEPDPPRARTIKMTDSDVIPIICARRFETLFILPATEHIIEYGVGDPDESRWQVRVADPKKPSNALHVKPGVLGSRTNLNIKTDKGHTYTFVLTECKGCNAPDMKIFLEPSGVASGADTTILPTPEEVALTAAVKHQNEAITELRAALAGASADLAKYKTDSEKDKEQELSKFRSRYALNHNCAYRFAMDQKPFFVRQICHDESFTYIKVRGDTPPAVYGEQDGQLSLLPAKFERDEKEPQGGTLIIAAVIPRGRLSYGKDKLEFTNATK